LITSLVSFAILNETKQLSEEKEVFITPKIVPIGEQITGYAGFVVGEITSNITYQGIIVLAVVALLVAIFRVKWVPIIKRKGSALPRKSKFNKGKCKSRKK